MAPIAAPFKWYAKGLAAVLNKQVDFDSDNHVLTAHTSSYTPDRFTHDYVNDLTAEVANGAGYTTGGVSLTISVTTPAAASFTAAATSTAYALGDVRRPSTSNGYVYQAVVAGTSGGSAPTWPTTVGLTVTDGTVTWVNVGTGGIVITPAAALWTTASFVFRYLVWSDRTPATTATQPLIALLDTGGTQTLGGGNLNLTFSTSGGLFIPVP